MEAGLLRLCGQGTEEEEQIESQNHHDRGARRKRLKGLPTSWKVALGVISPDWVYSSRDENVDFKRC